MSTPVLSKQQQRQSLSGKKLQNKGLRNVLAQPQDKFWPIVDAEKCSILEELLNRLMPAIKRPSRSIPWSQLRHMKKEERAQAKKEALIVKEENVPNPEIVGSIVLGINAITRSLEKENVCCILMEANIDPHLLVKHVIHMALNKKVPILMFPKLKTVTLNTIGFATAACALKKFVMDSPDHHFYPLYTAICDIFKDIPLPKNKMQLFKDEAPEPTISDEEDNMSTEEESHIPSPEPPKFTLSTDVYMYRSSCKERAFVPPGATESSTGEQPAVKRTEPDNFISLSKYDTDEYDYNIKKGMRYIDTNEDKYSKERKRKVNNTPINVTYLPLKVKRLQGNPNRVKATKISKQKKK